MTKVTGTKQRNGTYHFNIPIPAKIQHLYPAKTSGKVKSVFDGTMKTSDPKDAERQVRAQKTIMDRQVADAKRKADQDRIAATLDPTDARLLAELGGIEGLLQAIKEQRSIAAITMAGIGADHSDHNQVEVEGEDDGSPTRIIGGGPDVLPATRADVLERDLDRKALEARIDHLTAETRRLKAIAGQLGEDVPPPPVGIDEGVMGIQELADAFMEAHNYTVQNRESVQNTIRRWLELHGDMPIEKWTRAHINRFDTVLRSLPSSGRHDVRSLSILDAVAKGRADKLDTISYKTRKRYSDHMKALSGYAVASAGLLPADPFSKYAPAREKVKYSKAKLSDVVAYTPTQVGMILDHCAKFDKQTLDFWLPMIAAYTGARREEIGQLTVDNVRVVGNMHVIDISDLDPDQTIKNKHSLRSIPLPKPILEAGFIDYVQGRKASGAKYLFQRNHTDNITKKKVLIQVAPDKRGRFTESYGRNFPRTVRSKLGLTEPGMKFHSLRHSWTDAARRAKIDKETRRLIAGRLDGEDVVEAGYGGDDLLATKLEALEAIAQHVRD